MEQFKSDKISLHRMDCMELMNQYPDKWFDLAIVDPPYGIDINPNMGIRKGKKKRHKKINWDNESPRQEYFDELFRISNNQIIWGGNYFQLPPTKHFIFWDKMNPEGLSFSDGEMGWTSYNKAIRKFSMRNAIDGKIHPTQKPVALYEWILKNYAKPNDKILDTHLGSGSITIAIDKANTIDKMNLEFVACELDQEYFDASVKRFIDYKSQLTIF